MLPLKRLPPLILDHNDAESNMHEVNKYQTVNGKTRSHSHHHINGVQNPYNVHNQQLQTHFDTDDDLYSIKSHPV